jgi:TPR repeat protein
VQRRDIYSMNRLARMYLGGSGIDTDYAVARQLFEEAIDLGHPYAPTNLGRMYRDGVGVEANPARAEELFELAARRGDPYGAFDRAAMEMGKGDRGKASTAARYFATSAAVDFRNEVGDAIDNLRIIDEAARRQALDELLQEAGADVPLTGDLNADLIAAARVVWEEGNPRRDLF